MGTACIVCFLISFFLMTSVYATNPRVVGNLGLLFLFISIVCGIGWLIS
ncbi:MAG: hypothetical protein SPI08_04380 [Campylobacter sp.]|nr:hypothetical protein [Campylobacter lanienae]MDY6123754.1 hypothetical protein [Campylobacter sp.]